MPEEHKMMSVDTATQEHLKALIDGLGVDLVLSGTEAARYCSDWHDDVKGSAVAVLRPRSTADVSACVKAVRARGLCIVPQGGNTGLVLEQRPTHQKLRS